jgi:hypothetical protein
VNAGHAVGCCVRLTDGGICAELVEPGAPLSLCAQHALVAHDWVVREVGATDLLPSPCVACGSRVGVRYPSGWLCAACEWRVGDVPDAELLAEASVVDVVYYLRFDDRIKIGTTGNPRGRFASLPWDELLAFELGNRQLERRRHEQFAAHRVPRTEWFEWNAPLAAHIAEISEGVSDPWEQYALWRSRRVALRA